MDTVAQSGWILEPPLDEDLDEHPDVLVLVVQAVAAGRRPWDDWLSNHELRYQLETKGLLRVLDKEVVHSVDHHVLTASLLRTLRSSTLPCTRGPSLGQGTKYKGSGMSKLD